jgi:hypothetical protein
MNERDCAVMESRLASHEKSIEHIYISIDTMRRDIALIQASLNQIKYTVYGGLSFYVIDGIGLLETIKLAT